MPRSTRSARAAGFTLIELLIAMVVVAVVLGAAVALFTQMNEISRAQIHQADMQQAVRVAQREITRMVQMAGRGGLAGTNPLDRASQTPALALRNNVGVGLFPDVEIVIGGGADVPKAVEGTDVLTVRGVFNSSVLQVAFNEPASFTYNSVDGTGTIVVGSRTPTSIPQSLQALMDAATEVPPVPEALVLVNAVNELTYAVVEYVPGSSDLSDCDDPVNIDEVCSVTIAFQTQGGNGPTYATLSSGGSAIQMAADLASPAFRPGFVGVLEEYRYYIREETDDDDQPIHKFSRARVFPGTELAYKGDDEFLEEDIADNVFDLQVALGYDSSFQEGSSINGFFAFDNEAPPATGADDVIWENADDADDWLFNAADDEDSLDGLPWHPGIPPAFTDEQPQPILYYARVTTLGRTARPDRGFAAPVLDQLEDHVYASDDYLNTDVGRAHRREILQSIIDLRNLG